MGLNDVFLPERLPRQVIFAGDHHAEIVLLQNGKITGRTRLEETTLTENTAAGWGEITGRLQPVETGVVLNASSFIYNFFEFDKLPWQKKALHELVSWRLQKIFPEDIGAYNHRFYKLDKKRVFSILVRRSLPDAIEGLFQEKRIPLTFIGNSSMTILARMQRVKSPPDFFIESDRATCTMLFQNGRSPIYIRKFQGGSPVETVDEIEKTVTFVRNQYNVDPRRYWLIDYQDGSLAAASEERLATGGLSCLKEGPGQAPHIPSP
jgi:hypothetical protein